MTTRKLYRIEFLAESIAGEHGLVHPSSAAVAAAVENALRAIGLDPAGSRVEGSAEQTLEKHREEKQRQEAETEAAARNVEAVRQAASGLDGQG
jgi:hypothetical protein